ncbi:MAG: MetQ/NlpA family ABC transporter substrate-binding protein, partial [Sporomusa sp.]
MNKYIKAFALVASLILAVAALAGCGKQVSAPTADRTLKVGVTPGPHAEIMDVVKKVAEKDGLKIQVVEFNDYVQPNVALNEGDLDVNSFQHQPYLDNMVQDR